MIEQELHVTVETPVESQRVYMVRGDSDRILKVVPDDYTIPENTTISCHFERSNGTHFGVDALKVEDNTAYFDATQFITSPGVVRCTLKVEDNESLNTLRSFTFLIDVKQNNEASPATREEGKTFQDYVDEAESARDASINASKVSIENADRAEEMAGNASESAAAADLSDRNSKVNANNSLAFSEESRKYALSASESASAASISETNAQRHESNASNSAGIAKDNADIAVQMAAQANQDANSALYSAASAETNANLAGTRATAAATSASNAAQSEKNAASHASQANNYASSAGSSSRDAKLSETNAKKSAESAQKSASDANGFAGKAEAFSEAAVGSAQTAKAYADYAEQKASDAFGSASDAEASAEAAENSASLADSKAIASANSANEASNSALAAANSATESANSASSAAGSATSAQNSAKDASDSATAAENSENAAAGFAENASSSADLASTKATEASQSASASLNSANDAKGYSDSAKGYSEASKESADQSKADADKSAESASKAEQEANKSASSAEAAETFKNTASSYAMTAQEAATAAQGYSSKAEEASEKAETEANKSAAEAVKAKDEADRAKSEADRFYGLKGEPNGLAELDANGKVPSSQLPSYVDDVLEFENKASFPATGETGKIYVDLSTNLTYRWSGTSYVEISPSLALGETSSTAYAGDKGKAVTDAFALHTANNVKHITADERNAWNAKTTVTESTVSGWGFTKNTGTYSKPAEGIPKTDLESSVQTSLGKADTALQEHQDISGKVDKVSGKGLSTNDLTNELKNNYDAAYEYSKAEHARVDATKVEASATNGNIKINGTETTVYTHPGTGTNPHGTTKSDVGLGNVENKSSETIRSEITDENVVDALGFTPAREGDLDTKVDKSDIGNAFVKYGNETVLLDNVTVNMHAETDPDGLNEDGTPKWYISDPITGITSADLVNSNPYRLTIDGVSMIVYGQQRNTNYSTPTSLRVCRSVGDNTLIGLGNLTGARHLFKDFVLAYRFKNNNEVNLYAKSSESTHTISLSKVERTFSELPVEFVNPYIIRYWNGDNSNDLTSGYTDGIVVGWANEASGAESFAEGNQTVASGSASHAEGRYTVASGNYSHAEGAHSAAKGNYSHAEGNQTIASGNTSHVEGQLCETIGSLSHAGGNRGKAIGTRSFAHGNFVNAEGESQFVIGYGNDPLMEDVFEVGNGLNADGNPNSTGNVEPVTRQNAFRVTKAGVAVAQTGLQIGNTAIDETQLTKLLALADVADGDERSY